MKQLLPEELASDALAHAQTLALLDEVLAYLRRLPAVPATREFVARIESARAEPAHKFADRRAHEARKAAGELYGTGVWPSNGEPPLTASISLDNRLTIKYFQIDKRPKAAAQLLKDLASGSGLHIVLEPVKRR